MAVLTGAGRDIRTHKILTLRAVISGWAVLLGLFVFLGERVALEVAWQLWGWTRAVGYGTGPWWPFWISGWFTSYAGFAIAAWTMTRFHRKHAGPVLLVFVASEYGVLAVSAAVIAWHGAVPVPVPHPLYYIVSLTLPFQWRSGFVSVPAVTLLSGLLALGADHDSNRPPAVACRTP